MEEPERREADGREEVEGSPENESNNPAEDPTQEIAGVEDSGRDGARVAESEEFRRRLRAKDWHIRELYDELAAARLAADEAAANAEAAGVRVREFEEERARLRERLSALEEEERGRRRRREGQDRRVTRLEREIERREEEIQRLEDLIDEREEASEAQDREAMRQLSRKDAALDNALRRIEGLQRDLEERENEIAELKTTVDNLRTTLDLEHDRRQRVAGPENRLRAGIDLFNDSEHRSSVDSISKSLGQPEVRVALGTPGEEDDEPPVIIAFTWGEVAWRTYAANPSLAVEEPRVYQVSAGEGLPGSDHEPPNAHVGPDGRVLLGL